MAISRTVVQKQLAGAILAWTTTTAPTSWLLCDGSSLLRTDYPDLFNIIGTTFGAADSTHFNVPDLRARIPIGKTAANSIGGTSVGVTVSQSSSNTGNVSADHSHTADTGNDSANHTHSYTKSGGTSYQSYGINQNHYHSITTGNVSANHTHTLSAHTHTTPDLVMNFIIRT